MNPKTDPLIRVDQLITPELLIHIYQGLDPTFKEQYSLFDLQQTFENRPFDLLLTLARRSTDPIIRNLACPVGEKYAPIYYDHDCFLKLILKKGGFYPVLILWDLLVIDLDQPTWSVDDVKKLVMESTYQEQLFYIHRTPHGYHLYLMSQPMLYCSVQAIRMRYQLRCDPTYGTFSLYRGSSIRLVRKLGEGDADLPSQKVGEVGIGHLDPEMDRIYHKVLFYLNLFQNESSHTFSPQSLKTLWHLWKQTILDNDNFGLVHIAVTAPLMLHRTKDDQIVINDLVDDSPLLDRAWVAFRQNPTITDENLSILLRTTRRLKQYQNLYRIVDATEDYVIGVHIEEAAFHQLS